MSFRRSERSRLLHQEIQYQDSRWKEFKCWLRRKVFRRISWWKALAINTDEKPAESFSGGKNSEKAPTKCHLATILVETPEDPAATSGKEPKKHQKIQPPRPVRNQTNPGKPPTNPDKPPKEPQARQHIYPWQVDWRLTTPGYLASVFRQAGGN